MTRQLPKITIHPHSQKSRSKNKNQTGVYWPDFLKNEDLKEICFLATGLRDFELNWLDDNDVITVGGKSYKYNVGNIVEVQYESKTSYVTLGNPYNDGRNSYFQQIGPAFRRYIEDESPKKDFLFYALPIERPSNFGRVFTRYHHFMFSVLNAAGITGNWGELLKNPPAVFHNIEHMIATRSGLSKKNNNASYAYYDLEEDSFYLFLKTYGASKYESLFLALAAINIEKSKTIMVRELEEGELNGLPSWAQEYIELSGAGRVLCSSLNMGMDEHRAPETMFPPSLRTPRYRVNVRMRCGEEVCALCDNSHPRDIQAAHIWDVHKIKHLSEENKNNKDLWDYAADGNNGLWLCSHHHRFFDNNTLLIDLEGRLLVNSMMSARVISELSETITKYQIDPDLLSEEFKFYLKKRHEYLEIKKYKRLYP